MFIVELDHNFYIASMGPTSFKKRAKQYKTSKGAKIALASYRTRRNYDNAKITDLDIESKKPKLVLVT